MGLRRKDSKGRDPRTQEEAKEHSQPQGKEQKLLVIRHSAIDKIVEMPGVVECKVPTIQSSAETATVPQVQFLTRVVDWTSLCETTTKTNDPEGADGSYRLDGRSPTCPVLNGISPTKESQPREKHGMRRDVFRPNTNHRRLSSRVNLK